MSDRSREVREAAEEMIRASLEVPRAPDVRVERDPFAGVEREELERRADPEAFTLAAHRMVGQMGRGHGTFPAASVAITHDDDGAVTGAWVPLRVYVTVAEALLYGQPEGAPWPLEDDDDA